MKRLNCCPIAWQYGVCIRQVLNQRKKESLLGEYRLATCIAALEASFLKWNGIGKKAKGSGKGGQNQCKLHVVGLKNSR